MTTASPTASPTAGAAPDLTAGGLVTFRLASGEYATALSAVREVVRLAGLSVLPGMTPPLAGVLDLRGAALPVLDLRPDPSGRGDVLVLEAGPDGTPVGVAVDQVRAVVERGDLTAAGGTDTTLPAYVLEVLRGPQGAVFLVDLGAMLRPGATG